MAVDVMDGGLGLTLRVQMELPGNHAGRRRASGRAGLRRGICRNVRSLLTDRLSLRRGLLRDLLCCAAFCAAAIVSCSVWPKLGASLGGDDAVVVELLGVDELTMLSI